MEKKANYISYMASRDPEVLQYANELATLEDRSALDAIRQLILLFAPVQIKELKDKKRSQSAEPTDI